MYKSKGIYFALATAVISGLAIFFNSFAVKAVAKNPYQFTALKNLIVALILGLIVFSPRILSQIKKLSKKDWLSLASIGLIGGSVPFLLFFKGLSLASSTSAAFIHKTLFIWVTFLAVVFLKEKVTRLQSLALVTLVVGAWLLDGFNSFSFGKAESLILIATLLWSVEFVIAKKVLKNIQPVVLAWARMFFGVIIMLGFLIVSDNFSGLFNLKLSQLPWLVVTSIFLFGYVITWYQALKHEKASVVTSVLVLGALITALLNAAFITRTFPSEKLIGGLIIILGVVIFNIVRSLERHSIKTVTYSRP